ncbi:MAG: hypothetical protein ACI9BJ_000213, partial [Flavobacteriales bacterium]
NIIVTQNEISIQIDVPVSATLYGRIILWPNL